MTAPGIDVSKWQGTFSWPQIKADGYQFAFAKATEGAAAPSVSNSDAISRFALDPRAYANWAAAKAARVVRGFYHFARPDLGNPALTEARWFLEVIRRAGGLQPGDLLALDFEPPGSRDYNLWVKTWLSFVHQQVGFWPFLYSFRAGFHGFPGTRYNLSFAGTGGQAGLWLSYPDAKTFPAPVGGWPFVAIWQGPAGPLSGISGNFDHDVFAGDLTQLSKYGKPAAKPAPTPPPLPVPVPPPPPPPPPPGPPVPVPVPPPSPPPPAPQPQYEPQTLLDWLRRLLDILISQLGGKK